MELLVPSTFGADERDMKLRAVKYGILARTASIFGVNKITIYEDPDEKINTEKSGRLMEKYLNYAETPPYLRKDLIPFDKDLKYANILPALQTVSHGYSDSFREAVVKEVDNGVAKLDAGLEENIEAYGDLKEGERITIKMTGKREAKPVDKDDIGMYWSFEVVNDRRKLGDVLKDKKGDIIVTSAHGEDYRETDLELGENPKVVFGSAWRGIPSMIERGDLERDQIDRMVNFIPEQKTKTVRTEEALLICFSRLLG